MNKRHLADRSGEHRRTQRLATDAAGGPVLSTVSVLSGTTPGPPLKDLAARVSPTPHLLIATGSLADEIRLNEIAARAARPPVDFWVLGDELVGHSREPPPKPTSPNCAPN